MLVGGITDRVKEVPSGRIVGTT